jgi:hypothetical protein
MNAQRYHAALLELLRVAEAGELGSEDLVAIEKAARDRYDFRAAVDSGLGWASKEPGAQGFFRALRRHIDS